MKGAVIAFLLLILPAVFVEAAHEIQLSAKMCEDEQCRPTCEPARNPTAFNLVYMSELHCECSCGRTKYAECDSTDDCIVGLHCADNRNSINGKGHCKDACQASRAPCDRFDKCVVDKETSEVQCLCKIRPCRDMVIGQGVCAEDLTSREKVPFKNDCLFENRHCELRQDNLPGLKKLQSIQYCAELIKDLTGGLGMMHTL